MTDRPLRVPASALKAFIVSVFDRWGTPPAIADLTADLMVRTDLRGVDSHGVGMLPTYLRWHRRGWIVPAAEPKIARDEGTTAVVDGQQAFGHYTSTLAMELAIAKARAHGVGFVTCRNSNHYGAAANYSMMALAHDMIGLSMTNAGPAVVPTYGREAMLGTNPHLVRRAGRPPLPLRARHGHQHRGDRQAVGRAPVGKADPARVGARRGRPADDGPERRRTRRGI